MSSLSSSTFEPAGNLASLVRADAALQGSRGRVVSAALWLTCSATCGWILAYMLFRSVQPFPLDAFEEYQLHKAIRWADGFELYGAPESEPLPEAYPPLYFWLLGCWVRCFGETFLVQRALSLIALAGVVACGWWELRGIADRRVARIVFLTVLLSFHALVAKFFDVGKPDMLLTLWLALAFVTGDHRSWPQVAVGSVALWLASLTKQNAPLFLVPLCVAHCLAGRWRWALAWGAAMSLVTAGSYGLLNWASDGGFFHWVFAWTAGHGVDFRAGTTRMLRAIVTRGPVLVPAVLLSLLFRTRCRWTWCLVVALAVAAMGMSKAGGRENHLLPVAFLGAMIVGRWAGEFWHRSHAPPATWFWRWALVCGLVVALVPGLPNRAEFRWLGKRARETDDWVAAVRRLDGSVAVSHHLLLAREAGAGCFFSDLILKFPNLIVPAGVRTRIESQEFDYLVLEANPQSSPTPGWAGLIEANYSPVGDLQFGNVSDVLPRRLYMARRLAAYNDQ